TGARTLYIADLGAILQRGAHVDTLAALRAALPGIDIWLDAGYADYASMQALFERIDEHGKHGKHSHTRAPDLAALRPVFGTESRPARQGLPHADAARPAPVLPLDQRPGQRLTAGGVELEPAAWPGRVIAMTLDQVGSYDGPDLATFERLRAKAPAGTTVIG